jgi:hypothetical protein
MRAARVISRKRPRTRETKVRAERAVPEPRAVLAADSSDTRKGGMAAGYLKGATGARCE